MPEGSWWMVTGPCPYPVPPSTPHLWPFAGGLFSGPFSWASPPKDHPEDPRQRLLLNSLSISPELVEQHLPGAEYPDQSSSSGLRERPEQLSRLIVGNHLQSEQERAGTACFCWSPQTEHNAHRPGTVGRGGGEGWWELETFPPPHPPLSTTASHWDGSIPWGHSFAGHGTFWNRTLRWQLFETTQVTLWKFDLIFNISILSPISKAIHFLLIFKNQILHICMA